MGRRGIVRILEKVRGSPPARICNGVAFGPNFNLYNAASMPAAGNSPRQAAILSEAS